MDIVPDGSGSISRTSRGRRVVDLFLYWSNVSVTCFTELYKSMCLDELSCLPSRQIRWSFWWNSDRFFCTQIQRYNVMSWYGIMTSFDARDTLPRRWLLHSKKNPIRNRFISVLHLTLWFSLFSGNLWNFIETVSFASRSERVKVEKAAGLNVFNSPEYSIDYMMKLEPFTA